MLAAVLLRGGKAARVLRGACRELHGRGRTPASRCWRSLRRDMRSVSLRTALCMSIGGPQYRSTQRAPGALPRSGRSATSPRWCRSTSRGRRAGTTFFNDLLPLPCTEATLGPGRAMIIDEVPEAIGAAAAAREPIYLSSASAESTMSEAEFIRSVARASRDATYCWT